MNIEKPSRSVPARRPYVRQACISCRKRKVKCDGDQPCKNCEARCFSCSYITIAHPRSRPGPLKAESDTCRKSIDAQSDAPSASPNEAMFAMARDHLGLATSTSDCSSELVDHQQLFPSPADLGTPNSDPYGPSKIDFTLKMVQSNLEAMNLPAAILDDPSSEPSSVSGQSNELDKYSSFMYRLSSDPLSRLERVEIHSLLQRWFESVGLLYPIIDQQSMMDKADRVIACLEYAQGDEVQLQRISILLETVFSGETNKLRMVLAISYLLESGAENDQAQRLFQSAVQSANSLIWHARDIDGIQLLVLIALYHYHLDENILMGRATAMAARLCLEIGLHRRALLESMFPDPESRHAALKTFWTVYTLERRTSFNQGIPFIIQDAHMDTRLVAFPSHTTIPPTPCLSTHLNTSQDSGLYALLGWAKLAGKIWQVTRYPAETAIESRVEELEFLSYQIAQWYRKLPDHLILDSARLRQCDEQHGPTYAQAVLFAHHSQLSSLVYRPVLQSSMLMDKYNLLAETAAKTARETIQTLADLNEKSSLIRTHSIFFKPPLLAALGNLLLVVKNGGPMSWESSRAEIDIALTLIELLSTKSESLMRIWHCVRGLRQLTRSEHSPSESPADSMTSSDYDVPEPFLFENFFDACGNSHQEGE